jgi:hypothetical protein
MIAGGTAAGSAQLAQVSTLARPPFLFSTRGGRVVQVLRDGGGGPVAADKGVARLSPCPPRR